MSFETDTRTLRDHNAASRAVAFSSPSPRDAFPHVQRYGRKMSTESCNDATSINALPLMSAVGRGSGSKNSPACRIKIVDKFRSVSPFDFKKRSGHAALQSIIREKEDESASATISVHSVSFCPRKTENPKRENEQEC